MADSEYSSIKTRASLLKRLQSGDDASSWQEFYSIYGKLVRDFALGAGLTPTEAEEVVQETAIGTARHLPEYRYDPKVCRFKSWLLNLASWRVKDQLKKRMTLAGLAGGGAQGPGSRLTEGETDRTATVNLVADPRANNLDALFEEQWRKNLLNVALDRVKDRFSLKQFQVFDLLVMQEWTVPQVAKSLGLSIANVYIIRHRVGMAVRKEIVRVESQIEATAQRRCVGSKGPKRRRPPSPA